MLVLNRRPGESIIIDPDIRLTVLSMVQHRVRIGLSSARVDPMVCVEAAVVSPTTVRVEVGPTTGVSFDGNTVRIAVPELGRAARCPDAALLVNRLSGERIEIGDELWVSPSVTSSGYPRLTYGGRLVGEHFSVTVIRPRGTYVRLGVDAPDRKVVRQEILELTGEAVAV